MHYTKGRHVHRAPGVPRRARGAFWVVWAGVLLAGEGLHASSKGARVRFDGAKRTVTDGPFTEAKELIAGFWIWKVQSKQEAIDWLKKAPIDQTEVEIRQVFDPDDFGSELTPELKKKEHDLRQATERGGHG